MLRTLLVVHSYGGKYMYHLKTHTDLDGVSCGILAKLAYGEGVRVRYHSVSSIHGQVERFLSKPPKKTKLVITDLSVNEEVAEKLDTYHRKGGDVFLLDHHSSALHFNEYAWGKVVVEYDNGHLTSAASLLYDYLIEQEHITKTNALDEFVELVRLYDTWEWERKKVTDAKRLNDLLYSGSIDDFEEKMVERLQENKDHFFFDEFEKRYLDVEEGKIERYIDRKKRETIQTTVGDYCVGIVYAENYHSELGNQLGKDFPHFDYIALVNVGSRRIALRTIHDNIDVSEIAQMFEGGGHQKAAGCLLTPEAYELFVTIPFSLEHVQEDAKRNRYNLKESLTGSLYENRQEDQLLIFPKGQEQWVIEYNGVHEEELKTFEEAERYVKRNYSAWLARDDIFIEYLAQQHIEQKVLAGSVNANNELMKEIERSKQLFN
jgi:uncharacterized protein